MATIQELEPQVARARAEVERLQAESRKFEADRTRLFAEQRALGPELERQRQIIQDPNATEAQKNAAVDRATAIENEARAIGREISQSSRDEQQFIDSQINPAVQRARDLEQQLRIARQRAATQQISRDDAGPNTVGSGTVVENAQTARNNGASTVLPAATPLPPLQPSNASTTPTGVGDANTDPQPPRSLSETQGPQRPGLKPGETFIDTNQPPGPIRIDPGEGFDDQGVFRAEAGLGFGQGAPGDDQGRVAELPTVTVTASRIDELYGGKRAPITPQDNTLNRFASYTYSLSWYLVDPVAYRELVSRQKRDLKGFYLLVQSAGVGQNVSQTVDGNQQLPLDQQSPQVTAASAGRNQFFPLDYYIDNFEFQTLYPSGGESMSAAAFKDLSFTLTEPNGLTLLPNLYRACDDLIRQGGQLFASSTTTNYAAAMFCMVVRFYGYDENGLLQTPINNSGNITDSAAVVEKFLPFVLKNIKFAVGPRMVEYTIEGAAPEVRTGLDTNRGSIPQDFDLSGVTVEDLLVGADQPTTTNGVTAGDGRSSTEQPEGEEPPPAAKKADAAPKPAASTTATGLQAALNRFEQDRVRNGVNRHADVYEIKFADNIIAQAVARPPGELNKNRVGGTATNTAADLKLPEKSAILPAARLRSVRAGTPIVQFIDEVIRNSDYINEQAYFVYDAKVKKWLQQSQPAEQFAWFNIVVKAEPMPDKYDEERNDYAYKITYYVTPYEVPMVSQYFNPSGFRGFHKVYNWLFTGENTEVLNFEQNFDKLWTQALTADTSQLTRIVNQKRRMNSREQWVRHYYPASGEPAQGGDEKVFEPGANAADFLYGPNYGRIQLEIIGDPAWIPNAYYEYNTDTFSTVDFWPDGTINSTAGAAYFEMAFNRPVDYNLNTGLQDAGDRNYFADREKGEAGLAAEAQTYRAVRCKSLFRGGRFSQELEGAWLWDQTFNEPISQRTAQNAPTVVAPAPAQTNYYGNVAGGTAPEGGLGRTAENAATLGALQQERLNRLSAANQQARTPGPVTTDAAPASTPAQQIVREE